MRLSSLNIGNLRTSWRVAVSYLLIFIPVLFLSYTAITGSQQLSELSQDIRRELDNEVLPIANLQQSLARSYLPLGRFLETGNRGSWREFLGVASKVDTAFGIFIERLDRAKQEYDTAKAIHQEWRDLTATVQLLGEDATNSAFKNELEALIPEINQRITQIFDGLSDLTKSAAEDTSAISNLVSQRVSSTYTGVRLALAITMLVMFTVGILIYVSQQRTIKRFYESLARFERGELSHRIPMDKVIQGDLIPLGHAMNTMVTELEANAKQLEQLATMDSLTGVPNRRSFDEVLETELERAVRFEHPFSLMLVDADHFKSVNDNYGHQVGDRVLKRLAKRLLNHARAVDTVARYGGEEFAIILPQTDATQAQSVAERLREDVAKHSILVPDGFKDVVTVSIGIASYPNHAHSLESLIESADKALYNAKNSGRNRVEIYSKTKQENLAV